MKSSKWGPLNSNEVKRLAKRKQAKVKAVDRKRETRKLKRKD